VLAQLAILPGTKHLQVIARTLGVPFEDLYGLAGYEAPERLPSFTPYLRAKYELPPEAVTDLEKYFELLRNYYGIPKDHPVYPPNQPQPTDSKDDDQPDDDETEENRQRRVA
jgi:hypothetical protein